MLCSWLFGYKFALIYGGDILIFNLIVIIIVTKKKKKLSNPTQPIHIGRVGPLWWVGLG